MFCLKYSSLKPQTTNQSTDEKQQSLTETWTKLHGPENKLLLKTGQSDQFVLTLYSQDYQMKLQDSIKSIIMTWVSPHKDVTEENPILYKMVSLASIETFFTSLSYFSLLRFKVYERYVVYSRTPIQYSVIRFWNFEIFDFIFMLTTYVALRSGNMEIFL